jgi:hypothetical protein
MKEREKKTPPCFAHLDTVFPMGKEGFRESPASCMACEHKTKCLSSALEGIDGFKAKEEFVDRAYTSGVISFLERWSQKKELSRKKKEKQKGRRSGRR